MALESSTPTTVTLTWNDPVRTEINDRDGITGYEVFVNDARRGTTPSRRYTFTELSPGQAYIFKIRAMNEQGTALERHAATFEGSASSESMYVCVCSRVSVRACMYMCMCMYVCVDSVLVSILRT